MEKTVERCFVGIFDNCKHSYWGDNAQIINTFY